MQSFIISLNAVFPIAMMILLGILLKKYHFVSESTFSEINRFVFTFCLPVTLFLNIAETDLSDHSNMNMVLFCIIVDLILAFLSILCMKKVNLPSAKKGVLVQDFVRTNIVILGLPIAQSIYGADKVGVTSILIAWIVPTTNLLAVLVLEHYSDRKANLKGTIISILKNPIIIGALVGLCSKMIGLKLPTFAMNSLKMLNQISTPLALIALGGLFKFSSLKENAKILVIFDVIKMFILPSIIIGLAVLFGFRGVPLISIVIFFAGPAAVSSYSMAVQMGADGELAAQLVVVTTLTVIFSLMVLLTILGNLGLM